MENATASPFSPFHSKPDGGVCEEGHFEYPESWEIYKFPDKSVFSSFHFTYALSTA